MSTGQAYPDYVTKTIEGVARFIRTELKEYLIEGDGPITITRATMSRAEIDALPDWNG